MIYQVYLNYSLFCRLLPGDCSKYCTAESKIFMQLCRKYGVQREFREELLSLLHNPYFQLTNLAPTNYYLQRCEEAITPQIVQSCYIFSKFIINNCS